MKRNLSLDLMKSFCIFFVIITHFFTYFMPQGANIKYLFAYYIDMAVPLFLIISGYTHSQSLSNHNFKSIVDYFDKKFFFHKLKRIILPYAIILFIEVLVMFMVTKTDSFSFYVILKKIISTGGLGPGGYYPIIFLQILLWFPIVYYFFKRSPLQTFLFSILLNIGFEIFAHSYLTLPMYRILSFRYITFILLGIFLFLYEERIKNTLIPHISFVIGFMFITYMKNIGYKPTFLTWWTGTSFPTAFYAFSLLYFFMKLEPYLQKVKSYIEPLLFIGRASFHIFLTQMLFFDPLQKIYFNVNWLNNHIRTRYSLIICIAFCVIVGCLWYELDTIVNKKLTERKTASDYIKNYRC